jgi:ABC-type multidrug transport system ATPase subunit
VELKIDRLSKTYPNGVHALRDVSLTIAPGMFGLLGPNGAGKSTLMRILATLQEADAGRVRLGEIDVLRDKEAVRRTLGYLPQEFGLYPRATAEEMLDHFAVLKGVTDGRERHDTVQSLLQQTNLWEARHRRLGTFSGGMRQRFGIAVALIGNPRLIIVDEPTAGLDPAERARFLNLLSELGENAVVILSTHIVEDVSDLCQRMAIIHRGQILLEAEPQAAVRAVRGRVWRREVPREELNSFEAAHPVISTTLVGGRTVVHVHGDALPDDSFQPVEPDLKDVYFTVMRGIGIARPAAEPEVVPRVVPEHPVPRNDAPPPLDDSARLHPHASAPPHPQDSASAPDDRTPTSADPAPPADEAAQPVGETAAPADGTVAAAGDDPWARFRRPGSSA